MAKNQTEYQGPIRPPVGAVELVQVPQMRFLMIDGVGDPNSSSDYHDALQSLYSLAYTLKFALKKTDASLDFKVSPLEGLWWSDNMESFTSGLRDEWKWTMMIMAPAQVTAQAFETALQESRLKKGFASLGRIRLEAFDEGLSAQTMHIGPYSAEAPTVSLLHEHIRQNGYMMTGKHHEIYLGDPRRAAPDKLKTVIRQPVTPAIP